MKHIRLGVVLALSMAVDFLRCIQTRHFKSYCNASSSGASSEWCKTDRNTGQSLALFQFQN
jgi:hypothetical protein